MQFLGQILTQQPPAQQQHFRPAALPPHGTSTAQPARQQQPPAQQQQPPVQQQQPPAQQQQQHGVSFYTDDNIVNLPTYADLWQWYTSIAHFLNLAGHPGMLASVVKIQLVFVPLGIGAGAPGVRRPIAKIFLLRAGQPDYTESILPMPILCRHGANLDREYRIAMETNVDTGQRYIVLIPNVR